LRWRQTRQPVDVSDAGPRQSYDKLFYASPVIEMAMRYHFRVVPPRQLIKLHILETDRGRSAAAATFNGRWRPLDNVGLLRALFASTLVDAENRGRDPVALRLRLKGACLVPRQNAALNPRLATAKSTDYTSPKLFARGEG
jgi:DUF1365 family protein